MNTPLPPLRQTGAAVVEMALLLPLLLTVVFGIIDYGRVLFIRAARTAAVAAAPPAAVSATLPFTPLVLPQTLGIPLFPQNVAASAAMTVEP
jgi:hypothetical protein